MANAKELIEENLKTKNPYLDLGNCGLDGTEPALDPLAACEHLETLIFSNEWEEYDGEKQEWVRHKSQNQGPKNNLKNLPAHLPPNLQKLVLAGEYKNEWQIQDISFLQDLKSLQTLNVSRNKIQDISLAFLNSLPRLNRLILDGNPIQNIPKEIFDKGRNVLEDVGNYLLDIAQGRVRVYQSKVILIGNGRVGKTCLVKRWLDNSFDPKEPSTHAIQLRTHFLTALAEKKGLDYIQLNIWDFGGQEIYHATHRLFMQTQALFLLVWDWQTEHQPNQTEVLPDGTEVFYQNHPLPYWLSYAKSLGKGSPVLVIQSKVQRDGEKALPHSEALQAQEYNLQKHLALDSADGTNFDEFGFYLDRIIKAQIAQACTDLPESWWQVQVALRKKQEAGEKTLSLADFATACQENEVPERSVSTLRSYLHDTGFFFYQENLFQNQIILDQKWAIDAVYTLFDRRGLFQRLHRNGFFSGQDLADAWQASTEKEQELFLSFMESCEICVELNQERDKPFSRREFLAPQLLPDEPIPTQHLLFPEGKGLYFRFQPPFLHSAIIQRFIVRTTHLAKRENIRQNRIILEDDSKYALVEAFPGKNMLWVRIPDETHKSMLDKIRNELTSIQEGTEDIVERVSLDGEGFVELDALKSPSKNAYIKADNGKEYPWESFNIFLNPDEHKRFPSTQTVKMMNLKLNIAELISLINEAFTDSDLETFCLKYFEDVFNKFGAGQGKDQKINALVTYCKQHRQVERLLEKLQAERPALYAEYAPRLFQADTPTEGGKTNPESSSDTYIIHGDYVKGDKIGRQINMGDGSTYNENN
ncbi:MAG: hypothetical protein HC880_21890 [Bacteroidia bacterium]|nr:hypothetical protein [Bacteroidia bacterium]